MTITIFKDKDCKGASKVVSASLRDLKGEPFDKPSSIRMTADSDEVLLFKNDDWKGGVLYLRGKRTVTDLGKKDAGGAAGFGNSIRSVRIAPFQLDLNVTVVRNDAGDLPGPWASEAQARGEIARIVANANSYYADRQALLTLVTARITFRTSEKHFVLRQNEGIPGDWTERGEVDVIFIDRFEGDKGVLGVGYFPCWGQTVRVAAKSNPTSGADRDLDVDAMSYVLIHELGHYLGLSHNSANDQKGNIMFPTKQPDFRVQSLFPDQVEEMHQKLARNLSRKGDRN